MVRVGREWLRTHVNTGSEGLACMCDRPTGATDSTTPALRPLCRQPSCLTPPEPACATTSTTSTSPATTTSVLVPANELPCLCLSWCHHSCHHPHLLQSIAYISLLFLYLAKVHRFPSKLYEYRYPFSMHIPLLVSSR